MFTNIYGCKIKNWLQLEASLIQCDWSDNFGALLERLEGNFGNKPVAGVIILLDERLSNMHTVPIDALET